MGRNLTDREITEMYDETSMDLVSLFKMLSEELLDQLDKNQDKSPDDIIHEITKVMG